MIGGAKTEGSHQDDTATDDHQVDQPNESETTVPTIDPVLTAIASNVRRHGHPAWPADHRGAHRTRQTARLIRRWKP